jgi:hypothetical protein
MTLVHAIERDGTAVLRGLGTGRTRARQRR